MAQVNRRLVGAALGVLLPALAMAGALCAAGPAGERVEAGGKVFEGTLKDGKYTFVNR
jgi:hypothetical protein